MARKFLSQIRGQIASTLPDNTTGQITPANHRALLVDLIDSTTDLVGELFLPTPQNDVVIPTTFSQRVANYSQAIGGDPSFLVLDPVTGTITSGPISGFNYRVFGQIQIEAINGRSFEMGLAAGGIMFSFISGFIGRGVTRPVTASVVADIFAGDATTAVDMRVRTTESSSETVDIVQASLIAVLLPTETPPP